MSGIGSCCIVLRRVTASACFGLDVAYMKILMLVTSQHAVIKTSLGEIMYG